MSFQNTKAGLERQWLQKNHNYCFSVGQLIMPSEPRSTQYRPEKEPVLKGARITSTKHHKPHCLFAMYDEVHVPRGQQGRRVVSSAVACSVRTFWESCDLLQVFHTALDYVYIVFCCFFWWVCLIKRISKKCSRCLLSMDDGSVSYNP